MLFRSVASLDEKSIPLFQDFTRHHPPGGHDVYPVPFVITACRRPPSLISGSHESDRQRGVSSDRPLAEQSGREFTSAIPTTRASDGEIRERKVITEIRLDPRFNSQSLQSGTSPLHSRRLQTQSLHRPCRVASTCCLRIANNGVVLTGSLSSDTADRPIMGFCRPVRVCLTVPIGRRQEHTATPLKCHGGTISLNLGVVWEMLENLLRRRSL